MQSDGTHPSESTLERWKKDYAHLLKSFGDKVVAPRVRYSLCGDEKYFTVNGWEAWLFTIMCMHSRYIIAWDPGEDKKTYDTTLLLLRVILLMGKEPRDITIDKLNGWVKGAKNSLPNTIHPAGCRGKQGSLNNNNKHERFNGSLDTRFRLAMGFACMHSPTQDLYITYRNLVRHHMGIGMTPAEKLGVIIQGDDEEDKMITIIMHAALFCT